jgi:DHA1 family tetracycline resistance protein-like MFS transporter
LAVNFVGTLGFSIVTPFLVLLVTKWGGNAVIYGLVAATYSIFQLFGAPILGRLSDRIGRRTVLLFSQFGTLLSWGIFLFAFALPEAPIWTIQGGLLGSFAVSLPLILLVIARALDGLTGGNVSVSNAYLSDITTEDHRSRDFGRMAVSTNLGFIVGPALAGLLGATLLGEIVPVIAAFGISAAALALIQFSLVDIRPKAIPAPLELPSACAVYGQENRRSYRLECEKPDGFGAILRLPNMPAILVINFLVLLGFSFFYVAFPIHVVKGLSWSTTQMGGYFAFLSLIMVLVQGPGLEIASKRLPDSTLMSVGGLTLAAGFAMLFASQAVFIYGSAAMIALGNGLMWPTFMSVISKSAGSRLQGAVQGISGSVGAVASPDYSRRSVNEVMSVD